ncbi:hypothetical protein RJ640_013511 [Escallonia rubra]|uniref:Transposase (putative) gypsy type domain-containing protein n=1 Tax=Escallonia rubra TaxID=112253 RepID=A0AA88SP51_9ASTE|nr:hypothetical protein RJ640_013511 [Escallonia rubra]
MLSNSRGLLQVEEQAATRDFGGDVKDQAEDKANPKPWSIVDEKSSKMSTEDLQDLIREYPFSEGWYARLLGLQEPANYGTKFEMGIYEEQVKSGYRLPLHPFALRFFEHYRMAPGQLVPNGWRKLASLIYLVQTSGYKPDATDFMRVFFEICFVKGVANCPGCHIKLRGGLSIDEPLSEEQLEWAKIIPPKPIPAGLSIPPPPLAIHSVSSAETIPLEMASGSGKLPQGGFLGVLQKAKGKQNEKHPMSIEYDPIFRPRWTLRRDDLGMPDSQMYASGSEMLSRFEMARQIATLEKRLERAKMRAAEEVTKARDQGIRNFWDGSARDEWLKKRTEDGLEIYELGFAKAKEIFSEHFHDIPLDDFVVPAVVSPSGEIAMPSEPGDVTASHLPGEGPSGDAPEA